MRTNLLSLIIVICTVSNFACRSTPKPELASKPQTSNPQIESIYKDSSPQSPEPQNRAGLRLSEAQDRALKLKPMMTQSQVLELLGKPDETSSGTYGTAIDNPWQGITWKYIWWGPIFLLKRLEITFQEDTDTWVVNSWDWYNWYNR